MDNMRGLPVNDNELDADMRNIIDNLQKIQKDRNSVMIAKAVTNVLATRCQMDEKGA